MVDPMDVTILHFDPLLTNHVRSHNIKNEHFLKSFVFDLAQDGTKGNLLLEIFDQTCVEWKRSQPQGLTRERTTGAHPINYVAVNPYYLEVIKCLVKGLHNLHQERLCMNGPYNENHIVFVGSYPRFMLATGVKRMTPIGVRNDYKCLVDIIKRFLLTLPRGIRSWPVDMEEFFSLTNEPEKFEGLLADHCGLAAPLKKIDFLFNFHNDHDLIFDRLGLPSDVFKGILNARAVELQKWHSKVKKMKKRKRLHPLYLTFKRRTYQKEVTSLYRFLANCRRHLWDEKYELGMTVSGVEFVEDIHAYIDQIFPKAASILQKLLYKWSPLAFSQFANLGGYGAR